MYARMCIAYYSVRWEIMGRYESDGPEVVCARTKEAPNLAS